MKKAKHKAKLAAAVEDARESVVAEVCRHLRYEMKAPAVADALWNSLIVSPRAAAKVNAASAGEALPPADVGVWLPTETAGVWRLD